jgi:hypothetical protein
MAHNLPFSAEIVPDTTASGRVKAYGTFLVLLFDAGFFPCYLVFMPRKAGLDGPGALHHIIVKRRAISRNDDDWMISLKRVMVSGIF